MFIFLITKKYSWKVCKRSSNLSISFFDTDNVLYFNLQMRYNLSLNYCVSNMRCQIDHRMFAAIMMGLKYSLDTFFLTFIY